MGARRPARRRASTGGAWPLARIALVVALAFLVWRCPFGPTRIPSTAHMAAPISVCGVDVGWYVDCGARDLSFVELPLLPRVYFGNDLLDAIDWLEMQVDFYVFGRVWI